MKSIFSITLLFFISFCAFAQTPASVRYLLPGGKIVAADKLDSVLRSWNHHPFSMIHHDDKPGIIELVLQTDAMKKQYDEEQKKADVMLDQPAPEFALTDIYGQHYRLSELKGKVVVLNFWFTSCAPCREEMLLLNKIKNENDPQKVIFFALALDNDSSMISNGSDKRLTSGSGAARPGLKRISMMCRNEKGHRRGQPICY